MELTFQTRPFSWLQCVLREVCRREETAEAVVPDSWPDMETVLDAHACAMVRGKDLREGSVTVSGGIRGGILYLSAEDPQPRCLEFYLPFTVKLEDPSVNGASGVLCDVRVASVDGRMLNCRKAMLRVDLSCAVAVFCPAEHPLTRLEEKPPMLRIRQTAYDLDLPLEVSERAFAVNEPVELPAEVGTGAEICRLRCVPEITDGKLVGSKAVFRGNLHCRFLCRTGDGSLRSRELRVPFSQYCELKQDYDSDEQVRFLPVITGCELEQDGDTGGILNVHVLVQCLVSGIRRAELLEDAFTTAGALTPQWSEGAAEAVLDRPQTVQTLQLQTPVRLQQVLDAAVYTAHPSVTRAEQQAQVQAPVTVRLLGIDREGKLQAAAASEQGRWSLPMSPQTQCWPTAAVREEPYVTETADGSQIRAELSLQAICTGQQSLRTLCGGTMEEESRSRTGPSVLLRRASGGTDLWTVAKEARANEELLRLANGLEGEWVPEDRVLLIPVG